LAAEPSRSQQDQSVDRDSPVTRHELGKHPGEEDTKVGLIQISELKVETLLEPARASGRISTAFLRSTG
jgi:hypothetical protein